MPGCINRKRPCLTVQDSVLSFAISSTSQQSSDVTVKAYRDTSPASPSLTVPGCSWISAVTSSFVHPHLRKSHLVENANANVISLNSYHILTFSTSSSFSWLFLECIVTRPSSPQSCSVDNRHHNYHLDQTWAWSLSSCPKCCIQS